jgi:hypothetical protein
LKEATDLLNSGLITAAEFIATKRALENPPVGTPVPKPVNPPKPKNDPWITEKVVFSNKPDLAMKKELMYG